MPSQTDRTHRARSPLANTLKTRGVNYEARYVDCGKKNCTRCSTAPARTASHGPYWYLCWPWRGKWYRTYLGKDLDTKRFRKDDDTLDYQAIFAAQRNGKAYTVSETPPDDPAASADLHAERPQGVPPSTLRIDTTPLKDTPETSQILAVLCPQRSTTATPGLCHLCRIISCSLITRRRPPDAPCYITGTDADPPTCSTCAHFRWCRKRDHPLDPEHCPQWDLGEDFSNCQTCNARCPLAVDPPPLPLPDPLGLPPTSPE